jgi:hypothetical protein
MIVSFIKTPWHRITQLTSNLRQPLGLACSNAEYQLSDRKAGQPMDQQQLDSSALTAVCIPPRQPDPRRWTPETRHRQPATAAAITWRQEHINFNAPAGACITDTAQLLSKEITHLCICACAVTARTTGTLLVVARKQTVTCQSPTVKAQQFDAAIPGQ